MDNQIDVRTPSYDTDNTIIEIIIDLNYSLPWCILTGNDSPVKAAWSTSMLPWFTTQSAGTAEPDARRTKSPGSNKWNRLN